VSRQLPMLREQLPLLAERFNQGLGPWLAQWGVEISLDLASAKAFLTRVLDRNLDEWLATAFESARIGGSFVLALIGNAIVMPLVVFYLLLDWPQITQRLRRMVPPRMSAGVEDFLNECDQLLGQYLRGQLMVMVALAVFYSVGLALFGFQLALPVGVLTGLLVFIPYLGFGLGLVRRPIAPGRRGEVDVGRDVQRAAHVGGVELVVAAAKTCAVRPADLDHELAERVVGVGGQQRAVEIEQREVHGDSASIWRINGTVTARCCASA
jgi:hypothetical protein